jgi:DNA-binding XRE family transcriptional regulator
MKRIKEIIKSKEQKCFLFCPNQTFYNEVGIKQRRWGQIYRQETDPTVTEAIAIAEWFEVPVTELFEQP